MAALGNFNFNSEIDFALVRSIKCSNYSPKTIFSSIWFGSGGSHTPRRFFFNINLSNSIAPASTLTRVISKHYVLGCYDLLSIFKRFCPQRLETLVRSLHFSTLCQVNRSGIKDEKTKVSGIFNFPAMAVKWEHRFRANLGAQTSINTAI